nr:protein FAM221B [Chrysemys picta bellii]
MGRGGPLERLPLPTHPAHLCPGYAVRPIVPARRAELVAVAKAMHRDQFGREVQELFHLEREAALTAMQTGLYIGWRCPEYLWDCFRVGDLSKCFCGHLLREHQVYVGRFGAAQCSGAGLAGPRGLGSTRPVLVNMGQPDTVGQGWQGTRPVLVSAGCPVCQPPAQKVSPWCLWLGVSGCRCYGEEEGGCWGLSGTVAKTQGPRILARLSPALPRTGCWCISFESNFLCAACDRRWEEHETFFETAETRRKGGRPYGEAYLPFAEMPELRNAVLTGHPGHSSDPQAPLGELPAPPSHALPFPSPGLRSPAKQSGKKA